MSFRSKAVTCGLVAALAFGANASVALAVPEAELSSARERMEQLGGELSSLEAELDSLTLDLERTDNEIARTQQDMDDTKVELAHARDVLSLHMRSGYKSGGFDVLEFVLSSSSLEDLVSRIYYMEKVNSREAAAIAEVNELEAQLESQMVELEQQHALQQGRVDDAQAKVGEYQALVGEARAYYDQLDAEVQAELAAQAQAASTSDGGSTSSGVATAVAAIEETSSTPAPAPAPQEQTSQEGESQEDTSSSEEESYQEDTSESYSEPEDTGGSCYPGGGVASAYSCIGWPYVWGGYGPWSGGFDCSGLVSYCYGDGSWRRGCESLAYAIQNAGLWKYGMDNLSYGDLLFTDSEYNHVGIYIGGGMMIHAPTFGRTVCVDPVWACYGGGPFVMP